MKSSKESVLPAAHFSKNSSCEADDALKSSASYFKRQIRTLYKMSIKGVSVTNGTIDKDLIIEFNHFMAVMIRLDDRFFPEFDV